MFKKKIKQIAPIFDSVNRKLVFFALYTDGTIAKKTGESSPWTKVKTLEEETND